MAVIKVSDLPQKETLDADDKIVGYSNATGGTSLLLGQAFIDIQTDAETSATAAAKSASAAEASRKSTDAIATDAKSTITSLKSDALDAINSEKTESIYAVQAATKTAESAINAAKTSAVSSVNSERESALRDIANAKLQLASEEEAKAGTDATKAISPATLAAVLSVMAVTPETLQEAVNILTQKCDSLESEKVSHTELETTLATKFVASTTDLEDGVSELADGTVYFVYEE